MTVYSSPLDIKLSVPPPSLPRPKVNGKIRRVLWDLDFCFVAAKHWEKLSPVDRILLEEYGTDKLLELLEFYNRYVGHSIHYRLREKTPEEEGEAEE